MGKIVEMTGLAHYYIIVACVSGLAATFMANKVVFSPQDLAKSTAHYHTSVTKLDTEPHLIKTFNQKYLWSIYIYKSLYLSMYCKLHIMIWFVLFLFCFDAILFLEIQKMSASDNSNRGRNLVGITCFLSGLILIIIFCRHAITNNHVVDLPQQEGCLLLSMMMQNCLHYILLIENLNLLKVSYHSPDSIPLKSSIQLLKYLCYQ